MTEDEAKTKWCPFSRVVNTNGQGGGNRWDSSGAPAQCPTNSLCIGSACMAWRRSTVMIDRATNEPAIPGKASLGDLELRYSNHGFCGLAGAGQ